MEATHFSPAKINLFLAVNGRRPDGFHDLVSVVSPLNFGDELTAITGQARSNKTGRYTLECNHPDVPLDGSNLVLKAAEAYAIASEWKCPVHFRLTKVIPPGAGLGGGSSNAVAALRVLNKLSDGLLDEPTLAAVAATLGSDCALFLNPGPAVMRGRGEKIEMLPRRAAKRLIGRRVLVFKPAFGVGTPWAYQRMIARKTDYLPADAAEARLAEWTGGDAPAETLVLNNMEPAVFEKFIALPVLLEQLTQEFGLTVRMSGSGSACYALLTDDAVITPVITRIRQSWGASALVQEARLA